MFFNWKGIAIVLAVIVAVIMFCIVDLRCSGELGSDSHIVRMKGEWSEGKKAMRQQEAENLSQLARDLRVLAQQYKENGENRKAQRAIAAAQELDRKILRLLGGGESSPHQ